MEFTGAGAAPGTGACGRTHGPDSGWSEQMRESRGGRTLSSAPPPRLRGRPERTVRTPGWAGSGPRPAAPTLPALASLQRRAVSCSALLALKVGLDYFNRAIKRMLTYICQEIHF